MLNSEKGGWGFGQPSDPSSNPFAQRAAFSQPKNPFAQLHNQASSQNQPNGTAPSSNPPSAAPHNPFAAASSGKSSFGAPSFGTPAAAATGPAASAFGQRSKSPAKANPFATPNIAQQSQRANSPTPNVFAKQSSAVGNAKSAPTGPAAIKKKNVAEYVQPAWPKQPERTPSAAAGVKIPKTQLSGKRKNETDNQRKTKFSRPSPIPEAASARSRPAADKAKQDATTASNGSVVPRAAGKTSAFAETIMRQLAEDNIKPPRWPANPGSHDQRQAIERFRETHKAYREKARNSLMRAGLIDDPDKKRRLDEALVFKGICEDFCPEWEKITRIVEHDIRRPEKDTDENGDLVPMPSLMVKRLARSAAGQESPLPMDVRSVATLRRTLDYLIDDLIPSDDLLSSRHSFLWDRTRAIRIDFSFQKYAMAPDELKDQVYCLETIARFHVTALHLLSQDGFTPGDYSEQQEIEQLGKTLMSLIEVYDDCAQQEIPCENEAEFRGYYIIFNVHTPALLERVSNWDGRGGNPDRIKSAICIVQVMKNIREMQGPLFPNASPGMVLEAMSIFFDAIANPEISYTMACFAEIHFNYVRKAILQTIKKSFSRPRFGPKDLTPAVLKQYLRTDTESEAVEFFQKHGFQFSEDGYLMLSPSPEYVDTRVPHSFSSDIVERKRCGRSLPTIIHQTVYEDVSEKPAEALHSPEDSLFVSDSQDMAVADNDGQGRDSQEVLESEGENGEATTSSSMSRPLSIFGPGAAATPSTTIVTSTPMFAQNSAGFQNLSHTIAATTPAEQPSTPTLAGAGAGPRDQPNVSFPSPAPVSTSQSTEQLPSEKSNPFGNVSNASSPFGFLNKNNSSDSASSPTPPGSNIFSGLSSKTSQEPEHKLPMPATSTPSPFPELKPKPQDYLNKEEIHPPAASEMPTAPSSGFRLPASTTTSSGSIFGLSSSTDTSPASLSPQASTVLGSGPKLSTSTLTPTTLSIEAPATNQPTPAPTSTNSQSGVIPNSQDTLFKGAALNASRPFPSQQPGQITTPNNQSNSRKAVLDNFTHWFVCGDKGLMDEHLLEVAVGHALDGWWHEYQAAEEERTRKEESDKAWAMARNYREHSLGVKYFYRWHRGFRDRQRIRRMKLEREKARLWNLPENIAKRELAAKEEQGRVAQQVEETMLKRKRQKMDEVAKFRESVRRGRSVTDSEDALRRSESRMQSLEDALIATGIFNGVRDERAAAHYAAGGEEDGADGDVGPGSRRAENQRRTRHGLNKLKALPEPRTYKEGSKSAILRALCNGSGRDTMSMSTGSLRNSTFSSSYRSSLGHNGDRISKPRSRVSDPYWRLKARGLVRMPNGEYLHESIALPMLNEGKRIPGFGDYGLPPAQTTTPGQSPRALSRYSSTPIRPDDIRPDEFHGSPPSAESHKRKRLAGDGVDAASGAGDSPTGGKRAKSGNGDNLTDADSHLDDIARLLQQVENSSRKSSSRAMPD
ncbi:SAC3/GANP/Nin1/mts3/eIF-3 p25 family-domain-containing protein [Hypoxylon sp. FL1284]|nr:SAC3/GANP/Nin1/mts3/eIF-3 p25 family-domain-containing protein [Hypoxylon sp. FL1284]